MVYTRHVATFHGKHNRIKATVLIFLLIRSQNNMPGITVRELSQRLQFPYSSVATLLTRWHKWEYVKRKVSTGYQGRPCHRYYIAERGKRFVLDYVPAEVQDDCIGYLKQIGVVK